LEVEGELAEAVAEVLGRFAPGGVALEATRISPQSLDYTAQPIGTLRVCAYLPVDEELEHSRQRLEEALWYLGCIQPLPKPQYEFVPETNWNAAWKRHYHPIPVGKRLMVVPAWLETPPGERILLRIDPGMAFGTGTHPTTQLSLALIERLVPPGGSVMDIGCGTGILAVAALKLGAAHALGVDMDPQAVEAARQNAAANQVGERLELGVASLAEIRGGQFSIQQAPLVIANIIAPILQRLLEEGLADLVAPGGQLILSGMLEDQEAALLADLETRNLTVTQRLQQADWVALAAQK
jgi:ribosomal protein L11 methyltransferase